jgi:ribonuclease HI
MINVFTDASCIIHAGVSGWAALKASHLKSGMISSKGTPRKTGKKWR